MFGVAEDQILLKQYHDYHVNSSGLVTPNLHYDMTRHAKRLLHQM